MPACELCGKQASLVPTLIETVKMDVCTACTRFGQVLQQRQVAAVLQKKQEEQQRKRHREEPQLSIVEDYADRIRKKREQLGLKQVDLARMIAERESLIQKMETSQFEPPLDLAKKLEKYLHIRLIVEIKEDAVMPGQEKSEGFTLGHFMKAK